MITRAPRLHIRLQMAALLANSISFGVVALLAPGVLLLEPEVATAALVESAWTYPVVLFLAAAATALKVRSLGAAIWAVDRGESDVSGVDGSLVRRLNALPLSWSLQLTIQSVGIAALTILPQLRPSLIDRDTQISIVLLNATVTAATTLPLYVIARAMVAHALEVVPWRIVEEAMRQTEEAAILGSGWLRLTSGPLAQIGWIRFDPLGRVRGRLLYAVALPVALIALGAALLAHAHVRAFEARHRRDDAYSFARGVLEPEGVAGTMGRSAAISAAEQLGYEVIIVPTEEGPGAHASMRAGEGGARTMRAPLDDATAIIRFQPTTGGSPIESYALVAAVAIGIAAIVGLMIGRGVASDLASATRQVRLLGSQDVRRGVTRLAGPARFEAIAALGHGIEKVADRFREFARGRERVIDARESAQRMRDLFLASMSHDLRSPLNGILGFVALLQKGDLTPGQYESLAIIDRRGRELLELIENILDAAKVEAGRLDLARDWASPEDLLAAVVRRARELAEEKKALTPVEVVGELQPGIPPIFVDGPRLAQAVINVVANAVKFVDRGAVRVRIAHGASVAGRPGLKIEVEDQGRGIPESDLAQIFDAFRQPIRSRRHGGLGLGLAMTRAIVELHGGRIDVESSPERGSVFTLWIPLPSPASVPKSERPTIPPHVRKVTPYPRRPFVSERASSADEHGDVGEANESHPSARMPALQLRQTDQTTPQGLAPRLPRNEDDSTLRSSVSPSRPPEGGRRAPTARPLDLTAQGPTGSARPSARTGSTPPAAAPGRAAETRRSAPPAAQPAPQEQPRRPAPPGRDRR